MEAPDKIFIHRRENPLEITWSEIKEDGATNVEYIRKDTLLELAENFCKSVVDIVKEYDGSIPQSPNAKMLVCFDEFIDKINSL